MDNVISLAKFETWGGNSGGPIWVTGTNGMPYVVGIVSTATGYKNADGTTTHTGKGVSAFALDNYWAGIIQQHIASNEHVTVA